MKIAKNVWHIISYILLGLLVSLAGSFVKSSLGLTAFLIAFVITRLLLIYILYVIFRKERFDEQPERHKVSLKAAIPLSGVAGIAINLLFSGVIGILTPEVYDVAYYTDKTALSGMLLAEYVIVGVLWGCLLTPLTEELLFRGIVFSRLRKMTGLIQAIVIQSVLFGALHILTQGSFLQGLYTSCLGVVTILLYLWTGSIWPPIVTHMLFNTTSIIFMDLTIGLHNLPTGSFYVLIIAGFVVLVCTLIFIYRLYKQLNERQQKTMLE